MIPEELRQFVDDITNGKAWVIEAVLEQRMAEPQPSAVKVYTDVDSFVNDHFLQYVSGGIFNPCPFGYNLQFSMAECLKLVSSYNKISSINLAGKAITSPDLHN